MRCSTVEPTLFSGKGRRGSLFSEKPREFYVTPINGPFESNLQYASMHSQKETLFLYKEHQCDVSHIIMYADVTWELAKTTPPPGHVRPRVNQIAST